VESRLILDRYRPLHTVGEGGFGTVVLAWDTRMQRRVAIKRLPLPRDGAGCTSHPPGLVEARTGAMLNHPAIVTVLDFDTDADEAFLVMEYIDGSSLASILDHLDGPLEPDEASAIAEALTDALEFAHDNGVLHLDIKPENVLVTQDGRVKVADFGVAALTSLAGSGDSRGGTSGFMPPEQLAGRAVDARSDEWALATLVSEALEGSDVAPELERVLEAAMAPEPHDRYHSVKAFHDELLPLLGDPLAGRDSLASVVAELTGDDVDAEADLQRVGLWDRAGGRAGSALLRSAATIEAAGLAFAGLAPFALDPLALGAAIALVALAAALAPSLGVGLGLVCLVAGVGVADSVGVASLVALATGTWWWLLARRSPGAAVLPLAAPVLAAARVGLAQPLVAGFALRPLAAAVSALFGGGLAYVAAAATGASAPYLQVLPRIALDPLHAAFSTSALSELATSPSAYVALMGWPLAASVMSAACSKATRFGAVVGALVGSALLAGSHYAAAQLGIASGDAAARDWWSASLALPAGASLILVLVVITLGAPLRSEPDHDLETHEPDDQDHS
jgi:hypothetical protein